METELSRVESELSRVESGLSRVEGGLSRVESGLSRVEGDLRDVEQEVRKALVILRAELHGPRSDFSAMQLLLCFILLMYPMFARSEEPLLKPNDVIALVGGEDMVVASELGYLEAFVHAALPDYKLKFRSLAWEGDTVFEQRRDLNYPPLEAQLEKMGATVVIAQFGQMESLAGKEKVQEFEAAYQKLIARLTGPEKRRRIVLLEPTPRIVSGKLAPAVPNYVATVEDVSPSADTFISVWNVGRYAADETSSPHALTFRNDGLHLDEGGHHSAAQSVANRLNGHVVDWGLNFSGKGYRENFEALRRAITEKNRLWFHYSRPQNWAFLAGDRTNQPSSRDHIDRNKRWFPEELEKFVPLIEAKEKEIWELAAKLKH